MRAKLDQYFSPNSDSVTANLLLAAFWLILNLVRWLILIALAFLEPFVRLLFSAVAVLSGLAGLVYLGSSASPPVPFWVTLCVALGCLILMSIYSALLQLLSRWR